MTIHEANNEARRREGWPELARSPYLADSILPKGSEEMWVDEIAHQIRLSKQIIADGAD